MIETYHYLMEDSECQVNVRRDKSQPAKAKPVVPARVKDLGLKPHIIIIAVLLLELARLRRQFLPRRKRGCRSKRRRILLRKEHVL